VDELLKGARTGGFGWSGDAKATVAGGAFSDSPAYAAQRIAPADDQDQSPYSQRGTRGSSAGLPDSPNALVRSSRQSTYFERFQQLFETPSPASLTKHSAEITASDAATARAPVGFSDLNVRPSFRGGSSLAINALAIPHEQTRLSPSADAAAMQGAAGSAAANSGQPFRPFAPLPQRSF
jgi:hypothetical protein